eukprot:gene49508-40681_t
MCRSREPGEKRDRPLTPPDDIVPDPDPDEKAWDARVAEIDLPEDQWAEGHHDQSKHAQYHLRELL